MSHRPNILWICTDQQRFDTLGCLGNTFVHTPHIDELSTRGTLFDHAFCQSPICTPSRASFLTGRYPRTTRCRQNGQAIPETERLVTRILADAGYVCGLSGKLHLSPCHPSVADTEARINDGYRDFHWSHHPNPNWEANEYIQWLQAQGQTYATPPRDDCPYVLHGMPAQYHQTTWCAEKAVEFIEENRGDTPWLFSVNIFDPHHSFDPPDAYLQRYLDRLDEIPLPNYQVGELADKTGWLHLDHRGSYGGRGSQGFDDMTDRDHRVQRAAYWAMCDLIDDQVGRMLAALDRTDQRDNTIVIFMSDHGELLGDHGAYLKGPYFYEPCIHVPLIISWPAGNLPTQRCSALTELVDLAPTLLDAVGLPPEPGMQGRSLLPFLRPDDTKPVATREDIYCEYYNAMPYHHNPTAQATMVRTARHKLVVAHSLKTGELYDLQTDPNETTNLWSDPAHIAVKSDMLQRLCDRMAWTVDPLPPRQSEW